MTIFNSAFSSELVLTNNIKQVFDFDSVIDESKENIKTTFDFSSIKEENLSFNERDSKIDNNFDESDIELSAKSILFNKNGSMQLSNEGSARTDGLLINFKKGLFFKTNENFLLNLNKDIRINNNNRSIIYGDYLLYGSEGSIYMKNVRLIFLNGKASIVAQEMINEKEDEYIFKNVFFTSCELNHNEQKTLQEYLKTAPKITTRQEEWNRNVKEKKMKLSDDEKFFYVDQIIKPEKISISYNIIPKNEKYKNIEDNFGSIYNKYKYSEWKFNAKEAKYNEKTSDLTLKKVTFSLSNIPFIFFYTYKINVKNLDKAKTGLLPITPTFNAGIVPQIGISIPWYLRISNNMDFLFTANIFQSFGSLPQGKTNDQTRLLANFFLFQFRHLISKKNGLISYYSLKGSVTDNTQIINYDTRTAIFFPDGSYMSGYRGHFRSKAFFSITQTTSIKHSFLYITDPNYAIWYIQKYIQYHTNSLSIQDIKDRSFNKLEINTWTPVLLNYQREVAPYTVVRGDSFFRTGNELDPFGRLFIRSMANYVGRLYGFSRVGISSEVGHEIERIFYGTMIRANNSFRGTGYNTSFASGNVLINPNYYNTTMLIYGTYGQLLSNSDYAFMYGVNGFGGTTLVSSQVTANHQLFKRTEHGTLILDPMVSFQNNYGTNYGFFTNEDSFTSRLSFANLFEKNITSGIDGFVNGSYVSFGLKTSFVNYDGYKISYGGGIMFTISNFGNNYYLSQTHFGLYKNGFSNYVGSFSIEFPWSRLSIFQNHRIDIQTGKLLELYTSITFDIIRQFLTIGVSHAYIDKNIMFLAKTQDFNVNMMTLFLNAQITNNIRVEFSGSNSLAPSVTIINGVPKVIPENSWLFMTLGVTYHTGCAEYTISASKITLAGLGDLWMFGAKINISII